MNYVPGTPQQHAVYDHNVSADNIVLWQGVKQNVTKR